MNRQFGIYGASQLDQMAQAMLRGNASAATQSASLYTARYNYRNAQAAPTGSRTSANNVAPVVVLSQDGRIIGTGGSRGSASPTTGGYLSQGGVRTSVAPDQFSQLLNALGEAASTVTGGETTTTVVDSGTDTGGSTLFGGGGGGAAFAVGPTTQIAELGGQGGGGSAPSASGPSPIRWLIGLAVVGGVGYFGFQWWKKRKKKRS